MEPVINIFADGKLAYTGFASLAARRLSMSEEALYASVNAGMQLPQPKIAYALPNGDLVPLPRAKRYIGFLRDES